MITYGNGEVVMIRSICKGLLGLLAKSSLDLGSVSKIVHWTTFDLYPFLYLCFILEIFRKLVQLFNSSYVHLFYFFNKSWVLEQSKRFCPPETKRQYRTDMLMPRCVQEDMFFSYLLIGHFHFIDWGASRTALSYYPVHPLYLA